MSENTPQKVFKNPEKPSRAGFPRLQVLDILLSARRPVTVSDILKRLQWRGEHLDIKTVQKVITEINCGITAYTLNYTTVHAGKDGRSRARAYFLTLNKKRILCSTDQ